MRTMYRAMFGLGLVALFAGPAFAQGQGRGFGWRRRRLRDAARQRQRPEGAEARRRADEKAKEFAEKARTKGESIREQLQGLEGEERRTKMQELSQGDQ